MAEITNTDVATNTIDLANSVPDGYLEMVEDFILRLCRNEKKHTQRIISPHEALGVIEEEFYEVKYEIFKTSIQFDMNLLTEELLDLAAVALRAAVDLQWAPPKY